MIRKRSKKAEKRTGKPAKKLAYLYLARNVYRFQIAIPQKLGAFYDEAATINLPTGTGDRKRAKQIRDQLLVKCRADFTRLERELISVGPGITPAEIERIKAERQIEHQGKLRSEFWRDADLNEAESFYLSNHPEKLGAEALLRARGKPVTPENVKLVNDALIEAVDRAVAHDARGIAPPGLPPQGARLADRIEPWIEDSRGALEKRQRRTYKREASLFANWLKLNNYPETSSEITRVHAGEYLAHMRSKELSSKSIVNNRSALAMFWSYLIEAGLASENIWHSLVKRRSNGGSKAQRREARDSRKRPFTDPEVATLLYSGPEKFHPKWGPVVADAMSIAALHGMRVSEIANLRVRHCSDELVRIENAKTEAGDRTIPQHSAAMKIFAARMVGKKADEFLFPELPLVAEDAAEEKGAPISKHFTFYRRGRGVDDRAKDQHGNLSRNSRIDFHSLRRWAIAKMRNALQNGVKGYDPWVIASVCGHDEELPLDLTMTGYAGEPTMEAKRAALEAIKLPVRNQ